jgi:hypothetical protein
MKFPHVIYNGAPKPNSWCRWAVNRVKNRQNSTNIRATGETGSGKTYSMLAMGELMAKMMGKKFTVDDVYFSVRDIIDKVANEDPKPGTIFLLDEQQVAGGAKEHQSKRNKAYAIFMSTVRSKRYIFMSTLPFADMADKQVRRLFHVEMETCGVNLQNNTCRVKPRYLEHSRIKDKVYRKRLVITYVDPKSKIRLSRKVGTWDVPKPSEDLVKNFEFKKAMFQKMLYKQLSKELGDFETAKDIKDEGKIRIGMSEYTEHTLTNYQKAILQKFKEGVKVKKVIAELLAKEIDPATGKLYVSNPPKVGDNIKWMKKKGVVIVT